MKALRFGSPPTTRAALVQDATEPQAGPGEILVQVHAAGITPTEALWYPSTHTKAGAPRLNAIPGHEFSGVVAALGAGAAGFSVGQEVFGMNDWFAEGASAEFCVTKPEWIAPKPARLTHIEAASVPIGALTAWQGLYDIAKLKSGDRALIHGGSGSVGVFAIQLARRAGACVLTTASARNKVFLAQLGAEFFIDYKAERFEDLAKDIDVVFDGVGGEILKRSWSVLNTGGRLVTIAADHNGAADARAKQAFFIVEPKQAQLMELAKMLDSGALKPVVDAEIPFDHAPEAYAGAFKANLGRGKMVLRVDRR